MHTSKTLLVWRRLTTKLTHRTGKKRRKTHVNLNKQLIFYCCQYTIMKVGN